MKPIALQLYTVRDAAAQDFPGTIRRVAEIGYKGVEFAGLYGHDPKEIAALVKDLGLQVCSSHVGLPTEENIEQMVEVEKTLGNTRMITGFGGDDMKTVDMCKAAAAKLQKAAELAKSHGMQFGMHNHWWEFFTVDGQYAYDILMQEAPDMFSELDVYWTAYGKANPVEIVKKYGSRMPVLHIKDGTLEEGKPHTAVGSGKLDMPAIIGAADPDVLKWLIVELDAYDGDMMEAVEQSYKYLTSSKLAEGNK